MRFQILAAALALLALPATAQDGPPMGAEAFDAYVTGKTLTYAQFGQIFGTEEYLPDRRVRWRFSQDMCQYGSWYPKGDEICFTYEDNPAEHCWVFWEKEGGLAALSVNDAPGAELSEVQQTSDGLNCPGPEVGV